MQRLGLSIGIATMLVTTLVTAQDSLPRELAVMADTEREFAKTATVKGWRDAFLDYFADDAITIGTTVSLAKEGLRKQPAAPFSEAELVWEPRLGDVAASGDLGWLTGPSTSTNHTQPGPKPRHGCYLSVWRKQADGRWRVFIDVGAGAPEAVPFSPGMSRIAFGARYAGSEGKQAASKSLGDADRVLNGEIGTAGAVLAFKSRVTPASRLHRPGSAPIVGTDAIAAWLEQRAAGLSAKEGAAEASASGEFGYSYGTFAVAPRAGESTPAIGGGYVRLWNRDASGRWWLMVDVAQPVRP